MGFDPNSTTGTWEQKLRDVGARVEEEVRQALEYVQDEVVPEVSRSGADALKTLAKELHKLAEKLEEQVGRSTAAPPPPPPPPPPPARPPQGGSPTASPPTPRDPGDLT